MGTERAHLGGEEELDEAVKLDLVGHLHPGAVERFVTAELQVLGPFVPGLAVAASLDGGEETVALQPMAVVGEETLVPRTGPRSLEVRPRPAQQDVLEGAHAVVVHPGVVEGGRIGQVRLVDQPRVGQRLGADQQGVARERGRGAVGGVAAASVDGGQGQDLPDRLGRVPQKIGEPQGLRAHVPDAVAGGEGEEGEQNAAPSGAAHASSGTAWVTRPPHRVMATPMSASSRAGARKGSRSRTTRSASWPGAISPRRLSLCPFHAPFQV